MTPQPNGPRPLKTAQLMIANPNPVPKTPPRCPVASAHTTSTSTSTSTSPSPDRARSHLAWSVDEQHAGQQRVQYGVCGGGGRRRGESSGVEVVAGSAIDGPVLCSTLIRFSLVRLSEHIQAQGLRRRRRRRRRRGRRRRGAAAHTGPGVAQLKRQQDMSTIRYQQHNMSGRDRSRSGSPHGGGGAPSSSGGAVPTSKL